MSQVLLLNRGERNRIAEKLVITTNTVKRHLKAIFEKLDVHDETSLTFAPSYRFVSW